MVLDREALAPDVPDGHLGSTDAVAALVLARARSRHVTDLVVGGRRVVAGGKVLGLDEAAVTAEVTAIARHAAAHADESWPVVRALQAGLTRFYATGGHLSDRLDPLAAGTSGVRP